MAPSGHPKTPSSTGPPKTPSSMNFRERRVTVEIPLVSSPPHASSDGFSDNVTPNSRINCTSSFKSRWDTLKTPQSTTVRHTVLSFCVAQVFVVWLVVTCVVYLQDFALMSPNRLQVADLLGKATKRSEKTASETLTQSDCNFRPPVCQPGGSEKPQFIKEMVEKRENSSELPLVFFFAGVEGSGHKFFEQVFRRLPVNFSNVVAFEPDLHLTFSKEQTNVHPSESEEYKTCPKYPYARPLLEFAEKMSERLKDAGQGPYVRSRDSYPLGRVRTPLARPDLVNMIQLDGHLYRLKVLVLLRGLADSVRSAARMGYHGGDVGLQVRIVEDSMVHLDAAVRMLPCNQYMIVDFDWVAEQPEAAANALAEFVELNVTAQDVISAVNGARKTRPTHNAIIPQFGKALTLEEFFNLRSEMWPLLAAAKNYPYFFPKRPSDWPRTTEDLTLQRPSRVLFDDA